MRRRVRVVTEAIMVVDLVESTATTDRFGWYAVGRRLVRTLRKRIQQVCPSHGLSCLKSTGDGYLLAFANSVAERSAGQAVEAAFAILDTIQRYNQRARKTPDINLRFAIHFGQVDAVDLVGLAGIGEADRFVLNDREGPEVAYTFRLEAIDPLFWNPTNAVNTIPPQDFPPRNYIIASEQIKNILDTHDKRWSFLHCGTFRLKGFTHWHEAFLISRAGPTEAYSV